MSLLFAFRALFLLSKTCRRVEKFVTRFKKNRFLLGEIKSSYFPAVEGQYLRNAGPLRQSLAQLPGVTFLKVNP